jgi:hypothetical protein
MVATVEYGGLSLDVDPYHVELIEGLVGTPDIRSSDHDRLARSGVVAGVDLYGGRAVTLTITVSADAGSTQFASAVDALATAFAAPQAQENALTVQIPGVSGGARVRLLVRPRKVALPLPAEYFVGVAQAVVELFATDPLKYSDAATTITVTVSASPGGFVWPLTWPLVWAGSHSSSVVVTNSGNAPTSPLVRLWGPLTNPSITNVTTGRTVSLTLTIVTGDYVDIDFAARTVLLNGTANRYPDLNLAQWWTLAPGNSSIALTADLGAGSADIVYRSAWL